ncbi:DUF6371 domain-containing protein [Rufibacter aurantiacus]|uniref:DUF6371 domain-containing protein n=1 Tax=Rufibacter aurantiacus TaxID=2817374 RepID=UPI001B309F43|nr:DUF6371 domain-containing protein [Rufibacter aurantiacus]
MKKFRYSLEKYSGPGSRHACPNCGAKGKFSRYVDNYTGEHLHEEVGRCNRENTCGYHFKPKDYFRTTGTRPPSVAAPDKNMQAPKPPSYIKPSMMAKSMRAYRKNTLAIFLADRFGEQKAWELLKRYNVGTSRHWPGATVFWQVDSEGRVRTGKVMLYDAQTGKRVKEPFNHIQWAHRLLGKSNFHLRQCLFGEHLLNVEPGKPVAVVESEKTALIASAFYPEFVWLACGGASHLSPERCLALKGREIILVPDKDKFHTWVEKARKLEESLSSKVRISKCLEGIATGKEREKGWDIADYLLNGTSNLII